MKNQENTAQMFVVDGLAHDDNDKVADLTNNELGIQCLYDYNGTIAPPELFTDTDTAATGDIFQFIVKRADGTTEVSQEIKWDNIVSVTTYEYVGGNTQQVDYVGYDAENDTGSIDVINSNAYFVGVGLYGNTMHNFSMGHKMNLIYKSGSSASQYNIAAGLVKNGYNSMKYERTNYKPFKFEVVCDNAGAVLGTSVGTLTFVNGSNKFTADDIDDATGGGSALAVGDLIRVPDRHTMEIEITTGTGGTLVTTVAGVEASTVFDTDINTTVAKHVTDHAADYAAVGITMTASTDTLTFVKDNGTPISDSVGTVTSSDDFAGTATWATSKTDPVSKITALDTANNVGTLDREYRGESFSAEDLSFVRIAAASIAAADFGLKISGVNTGSVTGYIDTELTRFYTNIADCGDTDLSRSAVAGSEDPGRVAAVAQLEAELAGSKGVEYRNDPRYELPRNSFAQSLGVNGYDIVHIKYTKDHSGAFGDKLDIPNEVYIAFDEDDNVTSNFTTAIGK